MLNHGDFLGFMEIVGGVAGGTVTSYGALASFMARDKLRRDDIRVSGARRPRPNSFGEVSLLANPVISSGGGGSRYPMEEYACDKGATGSTFLPSNI